ncbi:M56 family metallopeptidase [Pontibacter korlensis]|uniref:M56 family metallopeptidase n=1 Tax=Pontibacter korlensis TaxID=400092 RepID=UPI000698CD8C|nr:M56 family metallopeptidase [Pontibacter korlensis]
MIVYLLKASFIIGIAYLFYKTVLQQESFFAANRIYFIACIFLAFVMPFVSLPHLVSHQGYLAAVFQKDDTANSETASDKLTATPQQSIAVERLDVAPTTPPTTAHQVEESSQVNEAGASSNQLGWIDWLKILYLFGVIIFSLNLLFQVGSVLYNAATATDKIKDGEYVIVNTTEKQAPCSFFNHIFLYPNEYDYETYEQIIAHEKIHARMKHSLDLLLAELAVIILWFNPFIWQFKKEIEKNNEYQTDNTLLEEEEVSKEQYQLGLVQIAVPNKPLSITTNYNQSLLKQRILMMNAKRSTLHGYWKYSFLAPLFFGTLLFINEPAVSKGRQNTHLIVNNSQEKASTHSTQEAVASLDEQKEKQKENLKSVAKEKIKPEKEKVKRNSLNMTGPQTDMSKGYWYSRQVDGDHCIDFKGSQGTSNWNMSRCFDKGAFQKKGSDTFVMTKAAGSLQLNGNLEAEVSQGKYTFTEDASFREYLADNNISSKSLNLMFHLFFGDVNKDYVAFLKKNYNDIDGERLLELAVHGIKMQDFQSYVSLFQKYSNKKPSIREVIEARIHGVDQQYVQEIQRLGFKDLSLKKIMEAKIHGVNSAYVESLQKAGYKNLSMDKIIEAKIHGMTPAAIKELQALGFGEISLDKMIELKIHDVNAAYINELRAAGLNKLSLDDYLKAKIHGISPASIKEINALGYKNLNFEDLMSAQIHGVDAAYVQDLKKAGFDNLTMDKTVEAKIHGINSEFISKARKEGYNLNSIDKYITLKIHGMAMESLKE